LNECNQNGTGYTIEDSTLAAKQVKCLTSFLVQTRLVSRGASKIPQSQRAEHAQLHLLFAPGKRPDRRALAAFVARHRAISISHDPVPESGEHPEALWPAQQHWLELLSEGLTFDLAGLAPGPAAPFPELTHRFDLPEIPKPGDLEALTLRPGPHLAAGGNSLPLMRTLLSVGCELVRHFEDLVALGWAPAKSAIGRRFFESVTSAWLGGGPFPALGLTVFVEAPDESLESVGLAFWIGQELRIEPPLSLDKVAATRLGIRLVNHLVIIGGLAEDDRIMAPDGTPLVLRPSRNRALISVWRE
jgi:hypothetical protein